MSVIKILLPVGNSLLENFSKKSDSFRNPIDRIKKIPGKEYPEYQREIQKIKKSILTELLSSSMYLYTREDKVKLSPEINSLYKLKEEYKNDELWVYLIVNDNVASMLVAEIIREFLNEVEKDIKVYFDVIKDLQTKDSETFYESGLPNLINYIYKIAEEQNFDNIVFNFSVSIKETIPYLTIMAQTYGFKIYYLFEETGELLSIPPFPENSENILKPRKGDV